MSFWWTSMRLRELRSNYGAQKHYCAPKVYKTLRHQTLASMGKQNCQDKKMTTSKASANRILNIYTVVVSQSSQGKQE